MESLNQLIARLQHLHLEQERILEALENIAADARDGAPAPIAVSASPVTVPVTAVSTVADAAPVPIAVPASPVTVPVTAVSTVAVSAATVFHIGQQVYITNHITHVLVCHVTEADRTAIVTHFTASRVGIRTINGFHTHRHPKNLRPL
jgi:hypothetical protein